MNKLIAIILLLSQIALPAAIAADDSGTFRGKWWNYYERAAISAEKGEWESAKKDLETAIAKRDRDQRMARTYGMHFVDYFPHRELGILYFNKGDMALATKELELSIKSEETAKAAFYLNKVKLQLLQLEKTKPEGPEITVASPASGSIVKSSTIVVKGRASGHGSVAKITVNSNPYRFDRALESIEFVQEVPVEDGQNVITIIAEDLLGSRATHTMAITVDRDGPSIQVFDIRTEEEAGMKYIRLIGEVSDSTGIGKLMVNNASVALNGEKSWPINLRWERGTRPKLSILTEDSFENETVAEIDVEKELAALNRPFKPYMVAALTDKIIGFDRQPPEVILRSGAEVPQVLSERFYVEGEASDNKTVERIVINNKEVFAKPGKKVFFSKVVSLVEGQNTITIDVYDSSDNKTTKTLTVVRKIPSVMQNNARMSITVLPFDGGRAEDRTQLAYEQLINAFVDQKRFSVIERAKLEQILLEQKLTKEKLTDPQHSIRVGKLMSADAILATAVKEDAKSIEIVARVVSTETSEILGVKDIFTEDKGVASIKEVMANLAAKIAQEFPVVEGIVIKSSGKTIYTDVGDASNIKKNMTIIVFRKGEELKHPITGKSLGWETMKLGEGRVEDLQSDFSKVTLMDKPSPKEVRVKDLIITK